MSLSSECELFRASQSRNQHATSHSQQRRQPVILIAQCVRCLAQCLLARFALTGVSETAGAECGVKNDQSTCTEQATSLSNDRRVLGAIAIDEHDVVSRILQTRQHLEGATGDQSRAHVVVAEGGEGIASNALVLGLDIDRGENTLVSHAGEQGSARDTGARTDLDDGRGVDGCSKHAEQVGGGRSDGIGAEVGCLGTS